MKQAGGNKKLSLTYITTDKTQFAKLLLYVVLSGFVVMEF
jgi:hypothetical protein